jgi:hypothetical protein
MTLDAKNHVSFKLKEIRNYECARKNLAHFEYIKYTIPTSAKVLIKSFFFFQQLFKFDQNL